MTATFTREELERMGRKVVDGVAVKIDGTGIGSANPNSEAAPARRLSPHSPAATAPSPDLGPRYKSKAEAMYADRLLAQRRAGDVLAFRYEAITLRIGEDVRYTPDFYVRRPIGATQLHEVKGPQFWEQARVKLGAAAEQYPEFEFYLVRVVRGAVESITRVHPITETRT
jgi:hypothetical protein